MRVYQQVGTSNVGLSQSERRIMLLKGTYEGSNRFKALTTVTVTLQSASTIYRIIAEACNDLVGGV